MTNSAEIRFVGVLRWLMWLVMILSVAACAARPDVDALAVKREIPEPYRTVTVITATDRQRDSTGIGYTADRSLRLRFERFTVASSASRKGMSNARPVTQPSGARKYVVIRREAMAVEDMNINNGILIYVHGYNYTFQESLFQLARIVFDGGLNETPILFSWPSEGTVTGYVADKDAAAYARDDLVELLSGLKKRHSKGSVTLFGHSMGAWIVVESLRQLKLSNRDDVLRRINQVVLAAPDIDFDLFKRQVKAIGPLARPMILLSSPDDRALAISSRIGGSRVRIGSVRAENSAVKELIAGNAIEVVDLSTLPTPDRTNHNRFIGLVGALSGSEKRRKTLLEGGLSEVWSRASAIKGTKG